MADMLCAEVFAPLLIALLWGVRQLREIALLLYQGERGGTTGGFAARRPPSLLNKCSGPSSLYLGVRTAHLQGM